MIWFTIITKHGRSCRIQATDWDDAISKWVEQSRHLQPGDITRISDGDGDESRDFDTWWTPSAHYNRIR